jgi:8-oxo-dGTP diphosphatase
MTTRPIVTVDVVLFTIADGALKLALIERGRPPFQGKLALIGGYLHPDADSDASAAAHRILEEKAGLADVFVEQLMTFSGPDRDPRGWSVSIAYYALVPHAVLTAAKASATLMLVPADPLPALPFDHSRIVAAALERLRGKSSYSSLPAFLLPPEFTFPELKAVYETVMGQALNDSAFRRKIGDLGIIEEVPEAKSAATALRKRPAQLYRLKKRALVAFDRTV